MRTPQILSDVLHSVKLLNLQNGIFTKALIEGINGKAVDEEGNITIDGLEKYIRQQVRTSTNGKQMPIFENKQGNYILFPKRN